MDEEKETFIRISNRELWLEVQGLRAKIETLLAISTNHVGEHTEQNKRFDLQEVRLTKVERWRAALPTATIFGILLAIVAVMIR